MIEKVRKTVEKYNMISPGDSIIVGLSGGADSICLLRALLEIKDELQFDLHAVHVNHGIRGEEAQRDEDFVKSECERLKVELTVFKRNIPLEAESTGESEEECGRRVRYECFSSFEGKIATAHNLTDSVETTVFNLIRGSALKGVCGIPAVRDNIIRPLIECTSREIRDFCEENGYEYVVDSTNLKTDYTRNYIRQEILPRFERVNSGYLRALSRFQLSALRDSNYLDSLSEKELVEISDGHRLYKKKLSKLDEALSGRVLTLFVKRECDSELEFRHIEFVLSHLDGEFEMQLNKEYFLHCGGEYITIRKKIDEKSEKFLKKLVIGENETPLGRLTVSVHDKDEINFNKKYTGNIFFCNIDYDKINLDTAVVRSREEGDKITLAKRGVTKSLKKLYNEMKIPPNMRDKIPVIADSEGIICVFGRIYNKRCEITDKTKKILTVKLEDYYA